jgi:hypothetical protein
MSDQGIDIVPHKHDRIELNSLALKLSFDLATRVNEAAENDDIRLANPFDTPALVDVVEQ